MISENNLTFVLETAHSSYAFRILPSGHPEHLYYGPKVDLGGDGAEALGDKPIYLGGNGISYSREFPLIGLEGIDLEFSSGGHGDLRDAFVQVDYANGSPVSDFLYKDYKITEGKSKMKTLPSAYNGDERQTAASEGWSWGDKNAQDASCPEAGVEELFITFEDRNYGTSLTLVYSCFPESDVICRRSIFTNGGEDTVILNRLMSLQLDLLDHEYDWHYFTGAWAREFNHQVDRLHQGRFVSESRCGISSSMNNPFVMLSGRDASETAGLVYGFNLIYSGNHREQAEVNAYGQTRILTGIHPEGFSWELAPGESFEAPEAVMSVSDQGFLGLSRLMHHFVREHIVRGIWKKKERPILLNSWEAMYFDFNEDKLLDMAKTAADMGVELFVMDDGWFGERNDASGSLGDWYVNKDKLPGGLRGLSEKINGLGMDLGIWVEPEMICEKSHLYQEHPDWAVEVPGTIHSEGRNQRILDLTRANVQDWLLKTMSQVFSSGNISYVKWDNNRIFTDLFSQIPYETCRGSGFGDGDLGGGDSKVSGTKCSAEEKSEREGGAPRKANRPGEFLHRYYMAYYRVMDILVNRFPAILFEGCASGGNRFDLGVLCYMPQIWASDDTDAICRVEIQTNISYGYPLSVVGAHVSASPNHQTGRSSSWITRFGAAAFGLLGYELNLALLTEEEKREVRAEIAFYKTHRKTLQQGDHLRLVSGRSDDFNKGIWQWICVAEDKSEAIGFFLQRQNVPNCFSAVYKTRGLEAGALYHFRDFKGIQGFGLEEDYWLRGSLLNHAGIRLTQGYAGRGEKPQCRDITDKAGRIYVMERAEY